MTLLAWHIWMIIGIAFIIVEIFDPAFFFVSLGAGAIVTGLLAMIPFIASSIPLQIFLFAIFSFIFFLFTRKLSKKVLAHTGSETNVFALKGKIALVTTTIVADGRGYVKVGGEEWTAVAENKGAIELGSKVEIISIEGNKLVVRKV